MVSELCCIIIVFIPSSNHLTTAEGAQLLGEETSRLSLNEIEKVRLAIKAHITAFLLVDCQDTTSLALFVYAPRPGQARILRCYNIIRRCIGKAASTQVALLALDPPLWFEPLPLELLVFTLQYKSHEELYQHRSEWKAGLTLMARMQRDLPPSEERYDVQTYVAFSRASLSRDRVGLPETCFRQR
ncbi:hypothetical protein BU26DRAFT_351640 [Trematosphaeria pertusa]|uniref:Uncharacterized protein n=1 Tax=Trematosphaeria pertusa TaxID=390896 RepID=A0A6A6IDN0_9PLEO|nr:uncharacterized protein BU26DRAFT_351640 [Trematosphaeria pertusa]KAF2247670.1 hypothetical protein BU26DRAFT_351640 [Trematosphaeria pertusa]